MNHISIAVVIPAQTAADQLANAIASVLAQTRAPDEIAVAIGPSTDATETVALELAKQHALLSVVHNPSGRTPDAMNLGIAATKSDIIVRVDAGSILPPQYIERALQTMLATGAANVGAVQHAVGTTPFEQAVAAAQLSPFGVGNANYRLGGGEPRKVETAYLGVFRRDAVEAAGGYDPYFTRNQDYELNWRLRNFAEGVWLDPELVVAYRPRGSLSSLARQYFQYGWWRAETIRKHRNSIKPRQLAAPTLVGALAVSTLTAMKKHPVAVAAPLAYGIVVVAASIRAEPREVRKRLLAVFPAMHLSWGSGFLASVASQALCSALRKG